MKRHSNVIIIGGGPAGLSAAMWCSELGLSSVVLEKNEKLGGQLNSIHVPIRNYPGIETSSGAELLERILAQLERSEFTARTRVDIVKIDLIPKSVELADGQMFSADALIIATGVRRRKLGIVGEDEFVGRGVLETGQTDRELLRNKRVMIVGGGDAALENAAALSDYAREVLLVHRRDTFSARDDFVKRVENNPRIQIIRNAVIKKISGGEHLKSVGYSDLQHGASHTVEIDALLIRIGVVPNTELFREKLDLDPKGYIRVSNTCETSVPAIFAIGDVASPQSPTIATAVGMGATAVKAIFRH